MTLSGQVAIVTGGANGIGAAIVQALWAQNASVAIVDLHPAELEAFSEAKAAQKIAAWSGDVTRTEDVTRIFAEITETLGPVSILVNNVGGSGDKRCSGIEDITDETWDAIMTINLGSAMRFSRAAVPGMKARNYGRIINIGSGLMHGMFANPGTVPALLPYATAKSGFYGFTRQLAFELARSGITVNAVLPGLTFPGPEAKITKRFYALAKDEQERVMAPIPAGRAGSGEDMANAVCFFASPAAGYVTGEMLSVSGGYAPS